MIALEPISVRHRLADQPVALLLHYLHVIPVDTPSGPESGIFHFPYALLSSIFYDQPWNRIRRVIDTAI